MDLPPTFDSRGGSMLPVADSESAREVAGAREANRACCAADAARLRWVARIVKRCRAEVRERVLALGDSDLDVDGEVFAHRTCVDSVMCAFGIGQSEATRLVNLAGRLAVLPEVWEAWSAGVLDTSRVRVLADATDVLDDATARTVARDLLASAAGAPWQGPAPRQWRTQVEEAVVAADAAAAARRRAAAVAARRVRSWTEGDGSAVLAVHAGTSDIEMADQVITDLARAWPATDPDGLRLTMDQRRTDAFLGLLRAVRDHSLTDQPGVTADSAFGAGSAFNAGSGAAFAAGRPDGRDLTDGDAQPGPIPGVRLPRVPVRRRHHNAKTLGVVRTQLTAGPGAGRWTVRWTLPAGIQVTTSPEPLPGTGLDPLPAAG
jgi:hypothetical protein